MDSKEEKERRGRGEERRPVKKKEKKKNHLRGANVSLWSCTPITYAQTAYCYFGWHVVMMLTAPLIQYSNCSKKIIQIESMQWSLCSVATLKKNKIARNTTIYRSKVWYCDWEFWYLYHLTSSQCIPSVPYSIFYNSLFNSFSQNLPSVGPGPLFILHLFQMALLKWRKFPGKVEELVFLPFVLANFQMIILDNFIFLSSVCPIDHF